MPPAYLRGPAVPAMPRANGCTGKVGFDSRPDAKRVATRRNVRGDIYECRSCGLWHISSGTRVRSVSDAS